MYIVIRRYHSSSQEEVFLKIQRGFVPLISHLPGFINYYVFPSGDDEVVVISMFDSEAHASDSTALAAKWVTENIAHLYSAPPEILQGEAQVSV